MSCLDKSGEDLKIGGAIHCSNNPLAHKKKQINHNKKKYASAFVRRHQGTYASCTALKKLRGHSQSHSTRQNFSCENIRRSSSSSMSASSFSIGKLNDGRRGSTVTGALSATGINRSRTQQRTSRSSLSDVFANSVFGTNRLDLPSTYNQRRSAPNIFGYGNNRRASSTMSSRYSFSSSCRDGSYTSVRKESLSQVFTRKNRRSSSLSAMCTSYGLWSTLQIPLATAAAPCKGSRDSLGSHSSRLNEISKKEANSKDWRAYLPSRLIAVSEDENIRKETKSSRLHLFILCLLVGYFCLFLCSLTFSIKKARSTILASFVLFYSLGFSCCLLSTIFLKSPSKQIKLLFKSHRLEAFLLLIIFGIITFVSGMITENGLIVFFFATIQTILLIWYSLTLTQAGRSKVLSVFSACMR